MIGKLIVIEGTDCSGKETQSKMLVEKLKKDGYKIGLMSFPVYESPTGKIIGACTLGKPEMCRKILKSEHSFFEEGGGNIDEIVACYLYAADRRYNLPTLLSLLENNDIVIVDRYVTSNMAHRGGMRKNKEDRLKLYNMLETLEYDFSGLPRPDKIFLLYMPYDYTCIIKKDRVEELDEAERCEEYLKKGEQAYLELADIYNFDVINCIYNNSIRTIEDINDELYSKVKRRILEK